VGRVIPAGGGTVGSHDEGEEEKEEKEKKRKKRKNEE